MRKNKRWTEERKQFLIDNYPNKPKEFLIEELGIAWSSIYAKASELKVVRRNIFTKEDIEFIVENYEHMNYSEIANFLGRDKSTVACKINGVGLVKVEKWTNEEVDLLIKNYPKYTNRYLSDKILPGRKNYSIRTMAYKYGLHKSEEMGKKRYDSEKMIDDLINLSEKLGRTPFLSDLVENGLASGKTYERYFDGYRNACKIAGLEINSNLWGRSISCKSINGDICFSKSEKIITDFFIENDIGYKKEIKYSNFIDESICGNKIVDWILSENIFVEYFGLPEKENYKKRMNEKISMCEKNDIVLIEVYRKDLTKLHEVFSQFL